MGRLVSSPAQSAHQRSVLVPLLGIGCGPVLVKGNRQQFLGWLSEGVRAGDLPFPHQAGPIRWPSIVLGAALVLVAVEKRGHASGRARMNVIPDFKARTIIPALTRNVAPGSTIYTDGLKSFSGLVAAGFKHIARIQPLRSELRKGSKSAVPLADRAIGNLQQ
jgi:hypothetical protein